MPPEAARTARLHAIVRGKVQGVYFRDSTVQEAATRGLRGWVRNLPDGRTVEVLAEGPRPALDELLTWLHQGPPRARVDAVDTDWSEPKNDLVSFTMLR